MKSRSLSSFPRKESAAKGLAGQVGEAAQTVFGAELPVGLRAWDGSRSGPSDGPTVVIRSPRAIRHLLRHPGELGLARAYVMGEIDIDGDFREGLRRCLGFAHGIRGAGASVAAHWPMLVLLAVRLGAVGVPPRPPAEEARLPGRRHTLDRDRAAIAHHYDLGNEFYESILDETMAYSCGYWTSGSPDYGAVDAQFDKLDLVCRKLALERGSRLLDVGCGWGSLLFHAAEKYGAYTTGVTNSARQHEFISARAAERGLQSLVEVRLQDYRHIDEGAFDAVSSIEMGEHVGEQNYPGYCATLHGSLRPGGRLLLQQMSRGAVAPGGGAFIEAYIAPDMTMRPLHRTLEYLERAGLEVREVVSMREHYVNTIDAWWRELEETWDEVTHRFGARRARIWRLYLAGGSLAFEANRMSVHQVLAVRTDTDGRSGIPPIGNRFGVSWAARVEEDK